jgi:two-component system, chemotaxis family, chemotaxis protein CheY
MRRLLIVDDSIVVRQQVTVCLQDDDYDIVEASDGLQGKKMCETQSFDLLILDVNMPSLTGLDMLKEVRKLPGYASTPVCFLTARSEKLHQKVVDELGTAIWILKPFSPNALRKGVETLLARKVSP